MIALAAAILPLIFYVGCLMARELGGSMLPLNTCNSASSPPTTTLLLHPIPSEWPASLSPVSLRSYVWSRMAIGWSSQEKVGKNSIAVIHIHPFRIPLSKRLLMRPWTGYGIVTLRKGPINVVTTTPAHRVMEGLPDRRSDRYL